MQFSRRSTLAGLTASLVLTSQSACAQPAGRTATGLRINDGDFAAARTSFRTRLLHRGPSPQSYDTGARPSDVQGSTTRPVISR